MVYSGAELIFPKNLRSIYGYRKGNTQEDSKE